MELKKQYAEPAVEAFYSLANYLETEFGKEALTERHLKREPESLICSFKYKGKKLGQIYYRKCQARDSYVSFEPNAEFTEDLQAYFASFDTPDRPVRPSRYERQLRFTDYEIVKDSVEFICKHLKQIMDEAK